MLQVFLEQARLKCLLVPQHSDQLALLDITDLIRLQVDQNGIAQAKLIGFLLMKLLHTRLTI
jgi:hypothetical protein